MKNSLPILNLPPADLQLRPCESSRGICEVYDRLRRKWLVLTPEECVRQNFVAFLHSQRNYPLELIANEYRLNLNGTIKRADTIIFDRHLRPLVVVEYKAPSVVLTQKVFDQIARYNIVTGAPILVVSNGLKHYCCQFTTEGYTFLRDIPTFQEAIAIKDKL